MNSRILNNRALFTHNSNLGVRSRFEKQNVSENARNVTEFHVKASFTKSYRYIAPEKNITVTRFHIGTPISIRINNRILFTFLQSQISACIGILFERTCIDVIYLLPQLYRARFRPFQTNLSSLSSFSRNSEHFPSKMRGETMNRRDSIKRTVILKWNALS